MVRKGKIVASNYYRPLWTPHKSLSWYVGSQISYCPRPHAISTNKVVETAVSNYRLNMVADKRRYSGYSEHFFAMFFINKSPNLLYVL